MTLFIFQFYPVCYFGKFISFGLGTVRSERVNYSGAPRARSARGTRAPYSWNMVNLFLFGCHVTERTYASTDCTGRVGETIKRKGGVSQACLGKSTSFILDIHNMVN